MNTTFIVVRIALGLMLTVFAANALFFKFFAPKIPERGASLMTALRDSGYLLTFVQGAELVVGLALLTGNFVPVALLVLLPISINIFLFHLFLAPPVLGPGLMILAANLFLLWPYKELLHQILRA
jgi:hypothetical protein